jgi:hypothetical protein
VAIFYHFEFGHQAFGGINLQKLCLSVLALIWLIMYLTCISLAGFGGGLLPTTCSKS